MSRFKDEIELLPKPGDTISETLEFLKMSQVELAERMGKRPSKVNDLISGKEPVTLSTALQLEKVLGIDAQFWINMEMIFREKLSRIENEITMQGYEDWVRLQPIKELKKMGYVNENKVGPKMVDECLKFYGVASPEQWQSVYVNQLGSTSFRMSEAHTAMLGGVATLLRIGEIEMRKQKLPKYNRGIFKTKLKEIRKLIRKYPEDFPFQLKSLCAEAGVSVVFSECIPKAPISGVSRWIGGTPIIQLTDRYKSYDQFWFSFFHEVAHILFHGKKDIFIEEFDQIKPDKKKEKEADDFASNFLLPFEFTFELPELITEKGIRNIAKKYDIHGSIVLARLQKLEFLPYNFKSGLRSKFVLSEYL